MLQGPQDGQPISPKSFSPNQWVSAFDHPILVWYLLDQLSKYRSAGSPKSFGLHRASTVHPGSTGFALFAVSSGAVQVQGGSSASILEHLGNSTGRQNTRSNHLVWRHRRNQTRNYPERLPSSESPQLIPFERERIHAGARRCHIAMFEQPQQDPSSPCLKVDVNREYWALLMIPWARWMLALQGPRTAE